MQRKPDIVEILERTQTGEYCTSKEWDTKKLPGAVKRVLAEHGLAGACDPDNPVNTDFELADTFYKAGYQLALELGFLCTDTDRIVSVSQEELDDALKHAKSELLVGYGKDGTWLKHRQISDPYPMKITASLAIANSEEMFPLLLEGIAREKEVDILGGGSMLHVFGREILSGTPLETLAGYEHARMHVEARRKAGRPGMGGINIYSAVTEFGQFGGYGVPGGAPITDLALVLFPSEMKIDYRTLHKVVHTINVGGMIKAASYGMIGGMAGPPEGAIISSIANGLLIYPILQTDAGGGQIYDVRYLANVNREGLWALSVAQQALSRNTHIITDPTTNQVSGAGTDKLLYEITASIATAACSGTSMSTSPRTAGGRLTDYVTPLECRFSAEVAHSASSLAPADVNEIVKQLLPCYEDTIKTPDLGRSFQDLYDLKTLTPIEEWENIYLRVKKEVTELGIPLD
jgi:methylamine--corrinoid protein Co-methyltransferase